MCSRIFAIWGNVFDSRSRFEAIPDKVCVVFLITLNLATFKIYSNRRRQLPFYVQGLIGKSVSRVFNRLWNYVFKGLIGTVLVFIGVSFVCVTLSTGSLICCVTIPLWYPIVTTMHHLGFVFFYDWEMRQSGIKTFFLISRLFNLLIFRLFICGVLQPICALATALIICPCMSLVFAICKQRLILSKN